MALAQHRLQQLPHGIDIQPRKGLLPSSSAVSEGLFKFLVAEALLFLLRALVADDPSRELVRFAAPEDSSLQGMGPEPGRPVHLDLLQASLHFARDLDLVLAAGPHRVPPQGGGFPAPVLPTGPC